ncbi:MAG: rhodanese-like domain-containing protein [Acidimicrobiales bacterium]
MTTDISPQELRARQDAGEHLFVLDVREPEEVAEWRFPGAHHIPLGELGARSEELPSDAPIVVVCHAGVRAAIAAEALRGAGWPASNLAGGVDAWLRSAPD